MNKIEESIVNFLKKELPGYKHDPKFKEEDWVWKWIQKTDRQKYIEDGWVITGLNDIDTVCIRKRKH